MFLLVCYLFMFIVMDICLKKIFYDQYKYMDSVYKKKKNQCQLVFLNTWLPKRMNLVLIPINLIFLFLRNIKKKSNRQQFLYKLLIIYLKK